MAEAKEEKKEEKKQDDKPTKLEIQKMVDKLTCGSEACMTLNKQLLKMKRPLQYHKTLYQCECDDCGNNDKYLCKDCCKRLHNPLIFPDFKINDKYVKSYSIDLKDVVKGVQLHEKFKEIYQIMKRHKVEFGVQIGGTIIGNVAIHSVIGAATPLTMLGSQVIPGLGGAVVLLFSACYAGVSWFRYHRGWIDKQEFEKQLDSAKTLATVGGISVGASAVGFGVGCAIAATSATTTTVGGSAAMGAIIGSSAPLIGTLIGAGVGLIVGCIILIMKYKKNFKEENDEKKFKKAVIAKALQLFDYTENDIENKEKFNVKEIQIRYKVKARIYHPDRQTGDTSKMQDLNLCYGVLLGVWEDKYDKKNRFISKLFKKAEKKQNGLEIN